VALDRRSRMLYDTQHVFINGESFRAGGRDAKLMHRLADRRSLSAAEHGQLSAEARELLQGWTDDGWLKPGAAADQGEP
jgi:50S ribosomal protein L16 3-hydroxylase